MSFYGSTMGIYGRITSRSLATGWDGIGWDVASSAALGSFAIAGGLRLACHGCLLACFSFRRFYVTEDVYLLGLFLLLDFAAYIPTSATFSSERRAGEVYLRMF